MSDMIVDVILLFFLRSSSFPLYNHRNLLHCVDSVVSVFEKFETKLEMMSQAFQRVKLNENESIAHMTFSDYHKLQIQKGIKVHEFIVGSGPAVLESIASYQGITIEAVVVADMTPVLERVMTTKENVILVNSEELQFIHTSSGCPANFQKCDLLLMDDGLQTEHVATGGTDAKVKRSEHSDYTYKFGTVPWAIRDMIRVIIEYKVTIAPADYGELESHLIHFSANDKFNTYCGILCDKSRFALQTCKAGVLSNISWALWTAPGSLPMLTAFCSNRNYWLLLLDEMCLSMNVSLVPSALLGTGGYGRVFKVKDTNSNIMYALKIVLFLQNEKTEPPVVRQLVEMECNRLLEHSRSTRTVDVVEDSFKIIAWEGFELGAGYLMSTIGEPVLPTDCVKQEKLTDAGKLVVQSLCDLHLHDGVVHGDARIHNVVWDPIAKAYKWIDFMGSSNSPVNVILRQCQDMSLLLNSMLPVKLEADKISYILSLPSLDLKYRAIDKLLVPA
mgnify:CR=1 FL=1